MVKKITVTVPEGSDIQERFQIFVIKQKGNLHKQSELIWEILDRAMKAEGQ
jgi:hypothetical protein